MEIDVQVRCRKSDLVLVKSILPQVAKEYADKLKTEVPKLKGRDIKCKLLADETNFLPELSMLEGQLATGYETVLRW